MGPSVSTGSQNEMLDPRCAGCVCRGEVVATGCPVCRHHYLLRRCPVTVESVPFCSGRLVHGSRSEFRALLAS
eukprot:g23263.t1